MTPLSHLLARRAALLNLIRNQDRGALTVERYADPMDSIQPLIEREAGALAVTRHTAELAAVDAAIERIKDGSYGLCEDCGGTIPEARLRAVPEAAKCRGCAEVCEGVTT